MTIIFILESNIVYEGEHISEITFFKKVAHQTKQVYKPLDCNWQAS